MPNNDLYIDIKLTPAEMLLASHVGCMRNVQSLKKATDREEPDPRRYWQSNITGALGELVVAKHLNLFWAGAIGDWKTQDVGGYEVKTNEFIYKKNTLMVKKGNSPNKLYILVAGVDFDFKIFGWIEGEFIMQEERWGDPFNKKLWCYHMDARELKPMSELVI